MNYGFIYCLTNHYMPGICKIGKTDRSPSQRCKELSDSTSAPIAFDIAFYAEVYDASSMERKIHLALAEHRVNTSREFFSCSPLQAYQWLEQNADIQTDFVDGDLAFELHNARQAQVNLLIEGVRV